MAALSCTLVSIPYSHYNERARWALDAAGVPYARRDFLPMLHVAPLVLWRAAHGASRPGDRVSSPASTPALGVTERDSGRSYVLPDSGSIVRWAAEQAPALGLYPPEGTDARREVDAVEAQAHDVVGPAVRTAAYRYMLADLRLTVELGWHRNVGLLQSLLWTALAPLWRAALRAALRVTPAAGDRAEATLRAAFAELSARLEANAAARGVPVEAAYLAGGGFTAADLSFAALAGPILGIGQREGVAAWLPPVDRLPPAAQALAAELGATPAGRHAWRMYRDHRPTPTAVGGKTYL